MFNDIVAHLCASFGWTWDYVEEHLDGSMLAALNRHLRRNPPTHVLVRWYLGLEQDELDPPEPLSEDDRRAAFVHAFQSVGGIVH